MGVGEAVGVRVLVGVTLGLGVSVAVGDCVGVGVCEYEWVALGCTVLVSVAEESIVRLQLVSQVQSTDTMNHNLKLVLFGDRKE